MLRTGIGGPYPPEQDELFRTSGEHGCLVSEFPNGTPPRRWHFPQRNRIIAGLARGVLVVEAPEKSGAMITADYALEEGKEVFWVPSPIHNSTGSWRAPRALGQINAETGREAEARALRCAVATVTAVDAERLATTAVER